MKTSSRIVASLFAALTLGAGAHVALAQPGGGIAGHGPGHGAGMAVEDVIASLKGQLNLDTSQQVMWDNVAAQGAAARASGRANMAKVRDALNAELAKAEPDFAAVATVGDAAQASNQALRKQVRDQWLKLYATFSPAQKAVVRDALKARVARMESVRERMQQRMGGGS